MRTMPWLAVLLSACGTSAPVTLPMDGGDQGVTDAGFGDGGQPGDGGPEDGGPPPPGALESALQMRLRGDWSGACVAAARITPEGTETALECADPEGTTPRGAAYEIGSITKTMVGLLVTQLIEEGAMTLDDTLASHLDVEVPEVGGEPIRIRHLLTHSSGLPSLPPGFQPADPSNPYADFTLVRALGSLAETPLHARPGEVWAYSNLGYMLLSHLVGKVSGSSFPELARARIFEPLGMSAFVGPPPSDIPQAQPHWPGRQAVPAWDFHPELAGVGGVRATLAAMILYARAALGEGDTAVVSSLQRASEALEPRTEPRMGSGWLLVPAGGRTLLVHNGGTGGSSSSLWVDRARGRAVVLLSDTTWGNLGGLDAFGLHLLDPELAAASPPRLRQPAPLELVQALAGRYTVRSQPVELLEREGELVARVGGTELVFGYDSYGHFFPRSVDALLLPVQGEAETTFDWVQGGTTRAVRQ